MIKENMGLQSGQVANTGLELNTVGMPSQMELAASKKAEIVKKEKDT